MSENFQKVFKVFLKSTLMNNRTNTHYSKAAEQTGIFIYVRL